MSSTDPDSSSLGFRQLDDSNYSIWKSRMTDALKKKKYWRYAQGTEPKPQEDPTAVYTTDPAGQVAKAKAAKALAQEIKEWEDNDDAAGALIRSGISDGQLHHVSGSLTAHEMWTRICSAHERQGINHALSQLNILVSTRLPEAGKVQEHINVIRTAHDRLAAADVGMAFPEQALAGILMHSFPSSYEPIKMTLSSLPAKDYTFLAVSRAMLNEEQRRLTSASLPISPSGSPQSDQSALAVQRPQQPQQQQQQPQPRIPCSWCGLDNHVERDCHRKADGEPQRTVAERQQVWRRAWVARRRTSGMLTESM